MTKNAARLDLTALSGVTTVIWLEGINEFSKNGNVAVDTVTAAMSEILARLRARILAPRQCPLYPQKRTLVEPVAMSAWCQQRTSGTM